MSVELTWTAVFESVEDGWVNARVVELPGVITAAASMEEAKEMLLDALHEYLASFEAVDKDDGARAAIREPLTVVLGV